MNPAFLDSMSWEMAEVYGAISDQILINLAHYFPYFKVDKLPTSAFAYQSVMLAQMGQVNRETARIIARGLDGANEALENAIEQAIISSVRSREPELYKAVKKGILQPPGQIPIITPNQTRAFSLYYKQAADKLNLVNTVMLESTQQAYQMTVSDIVSRMRATQTALDIGAGETITGVSSWNSAMEHAISRMKDNGITGFIDHAGRHWSAEAYAAMDIRTTVYNTARAAVWEMNQDFGNDLYIVSYHSGARPLCYDWQNKVISALNNARDTVDLEGNPVHVYAQSETTYGEPAGLFGINCKHYPNPFIPGVTRVGQTPETPEQNEKAYQESQTQRRLERKIREEKRDLEMLKAQNAPDNLIQAQRDRVKATSQQINDFCDQTGRARHRDREAVYTRREFPSMKTYDPRQFVADQKNMIDKYFADGGAQREFKFGTMTPVIPLVPNPPQTPPVNVAGQAINGATAESVNIFGETISFSEKMNEPKWDVAKQTINTLASEYKTKLKTVTVGAHHAAGDVQISGTIMRLSDTAQSNAIHEFAHSISISNQTKFKLYDESEFWKEIRKVRTLYRKAVEGNPAAWISTYEHSNKSIDEFMAEAFSLGYMREKGLKIPDKYGADTEFSSRVLSIVKKYFGK